MYLYDHVPGGVGLSVRIFERAADLLAQAAELVAGCDCSLGCPSCVGATAVAAAAAEHASSGEAASGGANLARFDRKTATVQLAVKLGLVDPSRPIPPRPTPPPTTGPPPRGGRRHLHAVPTPEQSGPRPRLRLVT